VKPLFGSRPTAPSRPVKPKIVRTTPDRQTVRAAALNRCYVVLMFTMIFAIGGLGGYALVASQHSGALVAEVTDRADDAHRMASALDREQVELLSPNREHGTTRQSRFVKADAAFEKALDVFEAGAAIEDVAITIILRPQHDAYVRNAQFVLAALGRDDRHGAELIEARDVRPKLEAIRGILDAIATESFTASEREAVNQRRNVVALEWLIAVATVLAVTLMSGLAVLLRRYQRAAVKAVQSQLTALEEAALTDNLTQLGNHRAFSDDFAREVARAKRNHQPLTLALIDVDDFKAVNATRGHAYGDEVLALFGEQLRTRLEDRAYRVGGDEFALLLVETSPAAAATVLTRLKQKAQETLSGATLSIGYVNLSPEQLDGEPYELAATALCEAKRRGRNNIVCFDDIGDDADVFSPRKAEHVRKLIKDGLLTIAFQPIWDIESAFPLAFEALARPAADLGLAGPQEAFDIAERIRQVYELDCVCIAKALEAAPNLPHGSTIFLNLAPASLAHPDFDPNAFVAAVRAAGLVPERVVIELTERRIENTAVVVQCVRVLRSLGVRMALDDTGSGHAGLEILSKLSVDFVKIDRSLLVQAIDDRTARGVLAGIIAIARETGSYLIAEGIENVELLDFACDAHGAGEVAFRDIRGVQGYLLGRPEIGRVDLRALELHHEYLETRRSLGHGDVAEPKAA
jgi:diguanylate cyclase (GGDEF)-like protein